MRVLLLGAGLQGRAVLHDLRAAPHVRLVRVADRDGRAVARSCRPGEESVERTAAVGQRLRTSASPREPVLEPVVVDAADESSLVGAMAGMDVVIEMLPADLAPAVARAAIRAGVHLVNCHYPGRVTALADAAADAGVTLLTECGLDPGIDLVLAAGALAELDRVSSLTSYGAGFPEPAAATGPLRYKVTWSLDGVLRSYVREARLLEDGRERVVDARRIFEPSELHLLEVEGLGVLEAFPNGDAVAYARKLGVGEGLRDTGRYVLRWPGHAAFWRPMVELGLLDDTPVPLPEGTLARFELLARMLEPSLRYADDERDVAVARVELTGERRGTRERVVWQLVDRRDLASGLYAMNRTVGFMASVAAQLLVAGEITRRGLASPARDIPADRLLGELGARGMSVTRSRAPL